MKSFDMYSGGFFFSIRKKGTEKLLFVRAFSIDPQAETPAGKLVIYTVEHSDQSHRMGHQEILSPIITQSEFAEFFPEGKQKFLEKIQEGEITKDDLQEIFPVALEGRNKAIEEILEAIK